MYCFEGRRGDGYEAFVPYTAVVCARISNDGELFEPACKRRTLLDLIYLILAQLRCIDDDP